MGDSAHTTHHTNPGKKSAPPLFLEDENFFQKSASMVRPGASIELRLVAQRHRGGCGGERGRPQQRGGSECDGHAVVYRYRRIILYVYVSIEYTTIRTDYALSRQVTQWQWQYIICARPSHGHTHTRSYGSYAVARAVRDFESLPDLYF